jgi:hypothetical protein
MSSSPITPEQWAALPPEARAVVQAISDHYERRIAELEAEIARLKKTPRNSSLPPSSEHPHAKPAGAKPKSKRKRGGQPGHEKHERALIPTDQCQDVIVCKPKCCRRCGRKTGWLWTCVAATFTVFTIRTTRAATVLTELLGTAYGGVVNCDRAKMYYSQERLQWCWAHLKRDFQALVDSGDGVKKRLGHDLLRPTRKLFRLWVRYRDGTLTRVGFQRQMKPIRQEVEALLLRGDFAGIGMAKQLYDHRQWLWTFVEVEGVEPTNNASERALRHAVIWRKLSFGTQSASGSRFVETLLTVVETCRQQSQNVFAFVTTAVEAHFAHHPAPSLAGA